MRHIRRGRWTVVATCTERGACPVLDWLNDLEGVLAGQGERMRALLGIVADDGPPRNTDISHQISDEIWEFIRGDLRLLWFYDAGRIVVCSNGFVKKSQKTPASEIRQAHAERKRYLGEKQKNAITWIGGDEA